MVRTACLGFFLLFACCACSDKQHDHRGRTPLVEVDDNFLYHEDLQAALPKHLSGEDSVKFVERYIRTWLEETLLYEKARSNVANNDEINELVENYRKALIMHSYQRSLIEQQLSDEITDAELDAYYQKNKDLFKAESSLIKGLFIKVPLKAPHLAQVRRWYKTETREAVEHLEKYSLQNAVKYEYFYDTWAPVSEILDWIPLEVANPEEYLNKNRHVELKDTAFHYFLNVSDFLPAGEQVPFEFARQQVKEMLLNVKQVEFMKQVKADLYHQAEEKDRIKYY